MKKCNKNTTANTLFQWHNFKLKLVFESLLVGILSGLVVVAYRYVLEELSHLTKGVYKLQADNPVFIIGWFLVLIMVSYIVGRMVKKEPMIAGSGIPQVEGVLLRKLKMNWFRVIIGKFIGGALTLGAGLSVGREGPSVQLGASVGQGFSKLTKRTKLEEKYLITSGASAGLAAAFNAPLAGVIFALEEIHKNFSPLVLLSAMSASLTADFISKQFFGLKPVFNISNLQVLPLKYYIFIIILGIIIGVFGVVFNKVLLKTQEMYVLQKWLPLEWRPAIPFIIAGVLGLILPQALGGGHELIESVANGNYALKFILLLIIVKFLFTMICFGSGVPGGIFLPLLVIGALTGNLYGGLLSNFFNIDPIYIKNFTMLAMAGYFTAIVKAPITGSVLITEMTSSFSHLLALTIVSITAYIVSDAFGNEPIYESLLERFLSKKGTEKFQGASENKVIIETPVCLGSIIDGKMIKEIKWPSHCLFVGIKRGQKEIIPKGETTIYSGDYLISLVDEDNASKINDNLTVMGENSSTDVVN